jgi:hypothetical protein
MSKFTGKNMVATFGSTGFTCLTSLESTENADVFTAACAGATYKARAIGTIDAKFTLNFLSDTATEEHVNFRPGTSGTFTASLNGTWGPSFSGAGQIESISISSPVEGFVTGTLVVGIDGALTVS